MVGWERERERGIRFVCSITWPLDEASILLKYDYLIRTGEFSSCSFNGEEPNLSRGFTYTEFPSRYQKRCVRNMTLDQPV